jgi:sugar lactone lactonase YvrE
MATVSDLAMLLQGGSFFEAPRWRDGRWWVSDFYSELVLAVDPDGRAEQVLQVDGQPSGLGWLPDGSLLVVSMRDRRVLRRRPDGEVGTHADVADLCSGYLNDMVVDRRGRAYVGEFAFDPEGGASPEPGGLIGIAADGSAVVAAADMHFPNGSVITPDGNTLIVGETAAGRYTAFTIEQDGSLTDRRVWAQVGRTPELTTIEETLGQLNFAPDGCTLDAEGHIWAADEVGSRCIRLARGGSIVAEIAMPEGFDVFACMLGGDDGRTLLMCAAPDYDARARALTRDAILLTTTVDVPHAGLP